MTTVTSEKSSTPAAAANGKKPKPNKKARITPRRANVAPAKAKLARQAKAPTKAPKAHAVAQSTVSRDSSKTAKILDLLKRPGGATSKELMKATGWLPHSVRGFLSGTVGKKMGLTVISTKRDDGERTYSVEAQHLLDPL
jgi:hypothetical protein